jgi:hypothetical protein
MYAEQNEARLTIPNVVCMLAREYAVLVKIGECPCLVDVRRWQTIGVRLIVDELRVHKVVDL